MQRWQDPRLDDDTRAVSLLAELSLSEKIGQLGTFWPRDGESADATPAPVPDAVGAAGSSDPAGPAGDTVSMQFTQAIRHGLGHLTRVFGSAPVSAADGIKALIDYEHRVMTESRLGIPAIAHEECLTGFTTLGATVYPSAPAWGATFDPDLIETMAAAIGSDLAAVRVHQGLAPVLDVVRDYRWGRVEEAIGEDPYLVGAVGSAYVRGLQSAGVLATVKHFCGYSASRAARNHAPVSMGRREFEEVMLPPFEMAVRLAGARSVMNSYSDVDGMPAAADHELLTSLLRETWGFDGNVVSDYWSVPFLESMHRVAADLPQAAAVALQAGIDVELPETTAYVELAEALERGQLTQDTIDTATRRVLRQKIELGLLDRDWDAHPAADDIELDSQYNRQIARRVAEESVVLLDNNGLLPLSGEPGQRIAVIGPCADDTRTFLGGYSFSNHVLARQGRRDTGLPGRSLADAVRDAFPQATVEVATGVPVQAIDRSGLTDAVDMAARSDVVVLALGDLAGLFGAGTSGQGCDVEDLSLPGLQHELAQAVLNTATPTISGRPYAVGELAAHSAAAIQAFLPGIEGGPALAGVLSGRINPSGKLPLAIPAHAGGQPSTYLAPPLAWSSDGISNLDPRPRYPFGHGSSYTTFSLSDLEITPSRIAPDGTVEARVTVSNAGGRTGSEVVQLYAADPVAQITRPLKQLIGFVRVELDAEESRRVSFGVHADRFSFPGPDHRRIVEPGEIQLSVGHSSEDRPLTGRLTITGDVRRVADHRVLETAVTVDAGDPEYAP